MHFYCNQVLYFYCSQAESLVQVYHRYLYVHIIIIIIHIYSVDISSSPDTLDDNLGPFHVKFGARAPVSKDIALETFLATIEYKIFDVHRARHYPVNNLSKSEHKTLHQLRTSKDIVVRLQDKGSRFVILDRTDYIDKVESNLNDGSFDLLPADLANC